jgi:hypothetical protein
MRALDDKKIFNSPLIEIEIMFTIFEKSKKDSQCIEKFIYIVAKKDKIAPSEMFLQICF